MTKQKFKLAHFVIFCNTQTDVKKIKELLSQSKRDSSDTINFAIL